MQSNRSRSSGQDQPADANLRDQIQSLLGKVNSLEEKIEQLDEEKDLSHHLLTRHEAADRLRVSTRKLDDLEASGRLQAIRIGRRVLYHPDTLEAFVRSQGEGAEK